MRVVTAPVLVLVIGLLGCGPVQPAERLGVVLLHGKDGRPETLATLADAIAAQGFAIERPELCWSHQRIYDRPYPECLRDIGAAVERLTGRGTAAVVVAGMSLGANGALAYAATHGGVKGVIAIAPGHYPEFIGRRPAVAQDLAKARTMIAEGHGDVTATFTDVNVARPLFTFSVTTTPRIYLSFMAPDSAAVMPDNAARLKVPLLLVSGTGDTVQRGRGYIFERAPSHPLNRYVSVDTDHIGTLAAAREPVIEWLKLLETSVDRVD
jgi:pimeloyl-ACP methyl ester carboxylesterase